MRLRALLGKPAVRVLLLLPVSLVLLYFAFRDVALEGFLAALGEAHLGWIIVAVLVSTASFFVRAARWQQLMNVAEYRVSFFSALYGLLFGYFFNLLIPRAGEVGRCTLVSQRSAISLEMAVGTVVTERVIDLLSTALLTLLAIGLSIDRFGAFLQSRIIAPFIEKQNTGGVIILLAALSAIFVVFLLVLWLLHTGRLGEKKRTWWNRTRKGLSEGVRSVLRLRNKGLFLFYTLLLWGCYWLMAYTISFALPATAHLGGRGGTRDCGRGHVWHDCTRAGRARVLPPCGDVVARRRRGGSCRGARLRNALARGAGGALHLAACPLLSHRLGG